MYRGKVKSSDPVISKRWAYGDKVTVEGRTFIIPDDAKIGTGPAPFGREDIIVGFVEVIPASVGRSTGLKDRQNGNREVYGGDLYRGHRSGTIYRVAFGDGEWSLVYDSISPPIKNRIHCTVHFAISNLGIKYVGNTTDTPELLQETGGSQKKS